MKPLTYFLLFCFLTIAFAVGFWYGHLKKPVSISQPLRLEEILSIKELHLVKHVYQDLFFLHKKNDQSKSIRAIVQVPVEITAYLNLKEIQVVYHHDSVKQVILPRAHLNAPHYKIEQMVIRETHAIQIHVGKDLYKGVSVYLSEILKDRMDTVRNLAAANRILVQAEAEGKAYIESLLKAAGRADVDVAFSEDAVSFQVIKFNVDQQKQITISSDSEKQKRIEELSFGFIPTFVKR
ncbi:MAG: DUF4230 domain-containing protein [Chryseolinea sp.]